MPIRVLPEEVSSAIAAGEVVERPFSVAKELIENSIDAGADTIAIITEAGGRRLIEVRDNGSGMHADDVPLSVARFATSKLATIQDLSAVRSLGFRGEALSSIAAVSRLELVTRTMDEEIGHRLRVEGGAAPVVEAAGGPVGTLVRVRDLFFNVPARRKFLKTERTERNRITDLVSRYAMAYPGIRFELVHDGRSVLKTAGTGEALEALASIYGVELARSMIPVPEHASDTLGVRGLISSPAVQRSNRRQFTFFVNGRLVQDASLSAAVNQAYHSLLMVGRYPVVMIFLTLPPESVDVNVHPAKAEVRFRDPGGVFSILQRVVRATLLGQAPPAYHEPGSRWAPGTPSPDLRMRGGWPTLSSRIDAEDRTAVAGEGGPAAQIAFPAATVPLLRPVGQVGAAYLVAEGPDGIYLIDQHAAHERVLFEAMMKAHAEGSLQSQRLLEPALVQLSPAHAEILVANLEAMGALGYEIEAFGGHAFKVRAVPTLLQDVEPSRGVLAVVEDFEEDEAPLGDELHARLAARVCKRAAVKAGQVLSLEEQTRLLRELEDCQVPRTCPHGRPTMIHLSVHSLERQFGRQG